MNEARPPENLPIQEPVFLIETERISPNPFQPRKIFDEQSIRELASSIREFGILQPLVVRKVEEEAETGTRVRYELIAGERRLRAAQYLGLERVPAVVKSVDLERTRLEMAIVENVQRANLNSIESARAYARLQDEFHLTQREIASRIGKSREVVANTLRLLNLPTEMQEAVAKGELSESQARLLLSVEDPTFQKQLFEESVKNQLSVRDLRAKIEAKKLEQKPASKEAGQSKAEDELVIDPEAISMQRELEDFLGAPVKLEKSGTVGKILIQFYSPEELRGLVQKMTGVAEEQKAMSEIPSSEEDIDLDPDKADEGEDFYV